MGNHVRAAMAATCLFVSAPCAAQVAAPPDDPAPAPPAGFAASFVPPPRDTGGRYVTPNRALSAAETTWHLRVALNVAALGCRDPALVAAYNSLLAQHAAPLAAADAGAQAAEHARWGDDWQPRHDDAMTRLYNYWAQSPARDLFCREAAAARQAAVVEPDDLPAYAGAALPRLEAPFLAAFAAFDRWRDEAARWRERHAPPLVMASAASLPVVPAAETPMPDVRVAAIAPTALPHVRGPEGP